MIRTEYYLHEKFMNKKHLSLLIGSCMVAGQGVGSEVMIMPPNGGDISNFNITDFWDVENHAPTINYDSMSLPDTPGINNRQIDPDVHRVLQSVDSLWYGKDIHYIENIIGENLNQYISAQTQGKVLPWEFSNKVSTYFGSLIGFKDFLRSTFNILESQLNGFVYDDINGKSVQRIDMLTSEQKTEYSYYMRSIQNFAKETKPRIDKHEDLIRHSLAINTLVEKTDGFLEKLDSGNAELYGGPYEADSLKSLINVRFEFDYSQVSNFIQNYPSDLRKIIDDAKAIANSKDVNRLEYFSLSISSLCDQDRFSDNKYGNILRSRLLDHDIKYLEQLQSISKQIEKGAVDFKQFSKSIEKFEREHNKFAICEMVNDSLNDIDEALHYSSIGELENLLNKMIPRINEKKIKASSEWTVDPNVEELWKKFYKFVDLVKKSLVVKGQKQIDKSKQKKSVFRLLSSENKEELEEALYENRIQLQKIRDPKSFNYNIFS